MCSETQLNGILAAAVAFCLDIGSISCFAKAVPPNSLPAEQRLAAFNEVWQTIRDGYYDTNYHGMDWSAIRVRYAPPAQAATNDYEFHSALRRMLVELHDGHTHYAGPSHVSNPNAKHTAFGMGFSLTQAEGRLVVSRVEAGSEADQQGVRPGMVLQSVDGSPSASRWVELRELVQRENSHSTGHYLDYLLCQLFFDGDAGKPALLAFETADGLTKEIQIKRRKAQLTFQEPPLLNARRLRSGLGCIRFNHWSPTLAKKLRGELSQLLDTPGLIIDLRGNNGGDIDFNLEVAGHFLPPKTVLGQSISRDGKSSSWLSRPNNPVYKGPVAVLVDAGSLSGSEFFAAYMRDCAKAVIVGRPSGGTLLKQTSKKISGGGLLHYSTHDYRSAGGRKIEGVGVIPDKTISLKVADLAQNRDADVAAAEEILHQPRSGAATQEWPTVSPEEAGMDSSALVEMFDFVRRHDVPVHSVQIVRRGRLVLDAYFHPFNAEWLHDVASVTKSITSTLIGLAIDQGVISGVKAPLTNLFPARPMARLDTRKQRITLEDLLTMRAGWDCGFEPKEARLFEMRRSADWIQFMLDLPMVAEPGERFAYCSGNCHLLSALLSRAAGTNALTFAQRHLFGPLDIRDVDWPADTQGHSYGWGDLQLRPLDMAKIGQLFLQRGKWRGRALLPESWVASATRPHVERTVNDDHYGYYWWVKAGKYAGVFEAVGRGGQRIVVWPAKELVLVFTGGGFEPGDLANFVVKSLRSDKPLPPAAKAQARLKDRLTAAASPPAPRSVPTLPAMARRVSGRTYTFNLNSAELSALALHFDHSTQALAELTWLGQKVRCPVGLDAVERFSTNSLVNLPVAAKGHWLADDQFLLQIDLVGRINCYRLKLSFAGQLVKVALSERTGLNDETFEGTAKL